MDVMVDGSPEYSSESDGEFGPEDTDSEFEESAMHELTEGNLALQNSDGTLRCPFCVGKKKRDYRYADLLQHATGVSKGKRSAEAAGRVHTALAIYLKDNFAFLAEPKKERHNHLEQDTPEKVINDELLVWPWTGIIMNIDNTRIDHGKRVGPGNGELKCKFSIFHPKTVHTFWNFHGHLGMAVIEFNSDMIGYGDAQDFERSFLEAERGRKDWERKTEFCEDPGRELYGWIASQQDYNGGGHIGKYLHEKGNLRTVAQVNESMTRQQDLLLQNLHAKIQEKNQKLMDSSKQVSDLQTLVYQTEYARRVAEAQKILMEEIHKQEIKAVEEEAKRIVQIRNDENSCEREKLKLEMLSLQKRCEELERQEIHNDMEREDKEIEIFKNEKKMKIFLQIQELHKQQEAKKLSLIKKQEEESKGLLADQHRKHKNLVSQHKLEQEIQAIEAIIEAKELEANANSEASADNNCLREKLNNLREEKEGLEEMNQQLTYKERELNDEIQDARKAALMILEKKGNDKNVGIKRMGELNHEPWRAACKEKYKNHAEGWEISLATLISEWENYLRDGQWNPFKVVHVKDDKYEQQVDMTDGRLSKLREDLGESVCMTVVKALRELDEYNASGRYPIPIAWNYRKGKKATLEEIINHLASEKVPKRKRRM